MSSISGIAYFVFIILSSLIQPQANTAIVAQPAYTYTKSDGMMDLLGYSNELVSDIVGYRTAFSEENESIAKIVALLPVQANRKYASCSVQSGPPNEIDIVYEFEIEVGGFPYGGGNGLDPYPESVRENNALLLFSTVERLDKVNFLHFDGDMLNRTDTYTMADLSYRFGPIEPFEMDCYDIYDALAANIQSSEFYFAHYSRIYLGADFESVSYRNGEPDKVISNPDGSVIWVYNDIEDSNEAAYYFTSAHTADNGGIDGLYATRFAGADGETFNNIVDYFGVPSTIKEINGDLYIAYALRDGQDKLAYFVLHENKVVLDGVMYGDDYENLFTCI